MRAHLFSRGRNELLSQVTYKRGSIARALGAALLASTVISLAVPAHAQSTGGLRGEVNDALVTGQLLSGRSLADRPTALSGTDDAERQEDPAPVPRYRPISEGAVPDEVTDDDSDTPTDSLFGASQQPEAPVLPSRPTQTREAGTAGDGESDSRRETAEASDDGDGTIDDGTAEFDLTTGTIRAQPIAGDEDPDLTLTRENDRLSAIEGGTDVAEDDPYAALGIRVGTFIVTPTLETGLTATSNVNSSPVAESAILSETTLRLNTVSDWSRHQATISGFGTWQKSISGAEYDQPTVGIDGALRLDLAGDQEINALIDYELTQESATSAVPPPNDAISLPLNHTITGSLGAQNNDGLIRYGLTGTAVRDIFSNADLEGGGTLSQKERNNTLYTGALRLGYEISPAMIPFVEGEYGRRIYDEKVDTAGFARSADRIAMRGGLAFDLEEKLNGEFAIGWLRETPDDSRLLPISAFTVDALVNWSPMRDTTVALVAGTSVEGTTTAGETGSVLYSGSVSVDHQIRANLSANSLLSANLRDYSGSNDTDVTLAGQLGLTWWLNRNVALTGRVRHERFTSTFPDRDSTTNSAFLGIRLQR